MIKKQGKKKTFHDLVNNQAEIVLIMIIFQQFMINIFFGFDRSQEILRGLNTEFYLKVVEGGNEG